MFRGQTSNRIRVGCFGARIVKKLRGQTCVELWLRNTWYATSSGGSVCHNKSCCNTRIHAHALSGHGHNKNQNQKKKKRSPCNRSLPMKELGGETTVSRLFREGARKAPHQRHYSSKRSNDAAQTRDNTGTTKHTHKNTQSCNNRIIQNNHTK